MPTWYSIRLSSAVTTLNVISSDQADNLPLYFNIPQRFYECLVFDSLGASEILRVSDKTKWEQCLVKGGNQCESGSQELTPYSTIRYLETLTFWSLLVTWFTNSLTFNNCTFCPHCISVFCIYLRTNSDLCHLKRKLIGFYNRDEKCLLRGTNWVFK